MGGEAGAPGAAAIAEPRGRTDARAPGPVAWPALGAVLAWGLSFPAVTIALEGLHPFELVAVRLFLGAALLAGLQVLRREPILPERGERAPCVLLGVLLAVHLAIQAFALLGTTSVRAGWTIAFIPVVIVLGARLFLGQRLGRGGWWGVAVAFAGLSLLQARVPQGVEGVRLGDFLMLLSCFTWAAYTLAAPRLVQRSGVLRVTLLSMASAGAVSALLALAAAREASDITWRVGAAAVFLGLLCSGAAFAAWARAVHEHGAARAASMLYLQPFVTLAAGVALGDPVGWNALVGGGIVLAGVIWIQRQAPAQASAPPRPGSRASR